MDKCFEKLKALSELAIITEGQTNKEVLEETLRQKIESRLSLDTNYSPYFSIVSSQVGATSLYLVFTTTP